MQVWSHLVRLCHVGCRSSRQTERQGFRRRAATHCACQPQRWSTHGTARHRCVNTCGPHWYCGHLVRQRWLGMDHSWPCQEVQLAPLELQNFRSPFHRQGCVCIGMIVLKTLAAFGSLMTICHPNMLLEGRIPIHLRAFYGSLMGSISCINAAFYYHSNYHCICWYKHLL